MQRMTRLLGLGEALAENIDPDNDEMLSTVIFMPRRIAQQYQRFFRRVVDARGEFGLPDRHRGCLVEVTGEIAMPACREWV